MVLEIDTRIIQQGGSKVIVLSPDLRKDSQFPFTEEDDLTVKIVGQSLVIRKTEPKIDEHKQAEDNLDTIARNASKAAKK